MTSVSLGSVFSSQFSDGPCVTLAYLLGLEGGFPEMEAFGHTLGHAGGFQSLIYPIKAIITFHRLSGLRIPLGRAPGACGDTALATDAEGFIDINNPILSPLLNGTRGTGRHTPWAFTVKTGHKNVRHPGESIHPFWANRNNLAEAGTHGEIVLYLAMDFAAETSNTPFRIVVYIVLAHEYPCFGNPLLGLLHGDLALQQGNSTASWVIDIQKTCFKPVIP
jgi:hypothetical protein